MNSLRNYFVWDKLKYDIRFWLLILFLLRLIGITNPPLEMSHSWRQSLTAMISRNFIEYGPNLLYPRIDMGGIREGIIGSEFPFFNYLIYLFDKMFGYDHWYGRLINLSVTTVGVFYFFRLIKGLMTERIAFFSALLLALSVWFGFARKIMPDTFSVSLVIIGLFYAYNYLVNSNKWSLLCFFIFITLGVLCKIPAVSLCAVLVVMFFVPQIEFYKKVAVSIVSILSGAVVSWWYFYWVPYLVATYRYELFFPRSFSEGIQEIVTVVPDLLEKFYFVAFSSFIAFACCLGGLAYLSKRNNIRKFTLIGISSISVIFGLFIIKTGIVFPKHSYYVVPFVPVMAFIAGCFLSQLKAKYAVVLTLLIGVESVANQQDDMFIKDSQRYKLTLKDIASGYVPKDSLVIMNTTWSPQQIFFAERRGWSEYTETLLKPGYLDSLQDLGGSYLIWDLHYGASPKTDGILYKDLNYAVYKLD